MTLSTSTNLAITTQVGGFAHTELDSSAQIGVLVHSTKGKTNNAIRWQKVVFLSVTYAAGSRNLSSLMRIKLMHPAKFSRDHTIQGKREG